MKKSASCTHSLCALLYLVICACEPAFQNDGLPGCPEAANTFFNLEDLHRLAGDVPRKISDSLTIKAVVISNDRDGNSFNELFLQDAYSNPRYGMRIEMELRDSYLRYPPGSELIIHLKGLWIRKRYGVLTLGKPYMLFGTLSVGRIPFHEIDTYIQVRCERDTVQANSLRIENVSSDHINTLVEIQNVEFIQEEIGLAMAEKEVETIRHLTDCDKREIPVVTSGYSDFFDHEIPDAQGSITGIVQADRTGYYLTVRSMCDIQMDSERCLVPVEPVSTPSLFISEIADPDNAAAARFVEIYNESELEIPLEGWQLVRYTNANTEPGSHTDLSGYSILPKSTFLVVADSMGFRTVFGIGPDLEAGKNSAADSNGDDTILLMDPFGAVIDIFGRIGEDGSGTDHEFEDGRALRKAAITRANSVYDPDEWLIYNDSGTAGTFNAPQQAPQDYTPGIRN